MVLGGQHGIHMYVNPCSRSCSGKDGVPYICRRGESATVCAFTCWFQKRKQSWVVSCVAATHYHEVDKLASSDVTLKVNQLVDLVLIACTISAAGRTCSMSAIGCGSPRNFWRDKVGPIRPKLVISYDEGSSDPGSVYIYKYICSSSLTVNKTQ